MTCLIDRFFSEFLVKYVPAEKVLLNVKPAGECNFWCPDKTTQTRPVIAQ